MRGRTLHLYVRERILSVLGDRPLKWLASSAGVPTSTLSAQLLRPKFSLEVVVRVADALGLDPCELLPPSHSQPAISRADLVQQIVRLAHELGRYDGDPQRGASSAPDSTKAN